MGTPFEIYNFPQTAFVANFVGTLNTADAEVVDPGKKLIVIDGVQLEAAEGLDGKKKGDKIRIAIRPERFNFASVEKKANIIDCTIENITFLGSVVRIQVQVGSNKFYHGYFQQSISRAAEDRRQRNRSPARVRPSWSWALRLEYHPCRGGSTAGMADSYRNYPIWGLRRGTPASNPKSVSAETDAFFRPKTGLARRFYFSGVHPLVSFPALLFRSPLRVENTTVHHNLEEGFQYVSSS